MTKTREVNRMACCRVETIVIEIYVDENLAIKFMANILYYPNAMVCFF
jgi:hypothetical protein